MKKNIGILLIVSLVSIFFAHATHAAQDNALMVEFGFGLGHMKQSKMIVARFRHENTMIHAGTWFGGDRKHNVVLGVGGHVGSPIKTHPSHSDDIRVGGDVGLALVFNDLDQPLQVYGHAYLGLKTTEQFDTQISVTTYAKNENVYRTFLTGGVTRVWDRGSEFGGRDSHSSSDCKPGWGHGDTNHCHDEPPGLD